MRSGVRRRDREWLTVIYLLLVFVLFGMIMALLRRPPRAKVTPSRRGRRGRHRSLCRVGKPGAPSRLSGLQGADGNAPMILRSIMDRRR